MGLIGSVIPLEIQITFNEMTGKVDCKITRAIPFPQLVGIFCSVLTAMAAGVLQQGTGIVTGHTPGVVGGNAPESTGKDGA